MAVEFFLQSIAVTKLKGMFDSDDIRLDEDKPLTALMGPNGFGKSSILHVLAASFRPIMLRVGSVVTEVGESHHYTDFLPSTPDEKWSGTKVKLVTRITKGDNINSETLDIQKKETGPWQPQQVGKVERETYYIGISTSLPEVEVKRANDDFVFIADQELGDDNSKLLKVILGYVFNRNYSSIFDLEVSAEKKLIGLTHNGLRYSSLSMGAGEQRIFKILKIAISAQKHALILIDEIDLLLHTEALHRLLEKLHEIAKKKSLQIIFTSHRESIIKCSTNIAIRHVYKSTSTPFKTYWFVDTKPGALERLTGEPSRSLSICCEDDVAKTIISKVAEQIGISKHVDIKTFGAWMNCFTLVAALALENKLKEDTLFVLDGDINECKTSAQWKTLINKLITGQSCDTKKQKEIAVSLISQFSSSNGESPERTLYDILRSGAINVHDSEKPLIEAFMQVEAVANSHDYLQEPLRRMNIERAVGVERVVSIASRSDAWSIYVKPIHEWLSAKKSALQEQG